MPRSPKRDSALLPALEARARVEQTAEDIAASTEMFLDAIPGGKLIPIDRLHEWGAQPRKTFDEARLGELAASIAEVGVLEPMIVRRHPERAGHYIVTAGMRRLLAARRVYGAEDPEARRRVEVVPCVIREAADREAFADALVENLARQDLTRREVMDAVVALQDEYGWSIREISRRTGRDDGDLSRLIRVGRDPEVAALVAEEIIAPTTAHHIIEVGDSAVRHTIVERVRSGALRTGPEVQTAISVELGRRARARAEVRGALPPQLTPLGSATTPTMPPSAGMSPASPATEAPQRDQADHHAPDADTSYGQVLYIQHPSPGETPTQQAHETPRPGERVDRSALEERIPVQAHTRRIGASSRMERLATYIITSLNQFDHEPVDRATILKLREAQERLARYIAAHETPPGRR